ncbi:DUF58 domain-containing protein [Bacillus alkalicellulosilyticus]|uniref:DUF58 domain-containing protein n=1 Tax=Alkalihalobacterium alkalicellulosilyticum TaxID=1912214 RepID=UPI001482F797|nr:DUF58 domain-containing protein [Bacillus alkalicellulosilyticus]
MGIHWLIILSFVIVVAQSYAFAKWGLSRLQYSRYFTHSVVSQGDEIEMVEEIANKKPLPLPWLRLESRIDSSLQFHKQDNLDVVNDHFHRSLFSLLPYQKIKRRHKVVCARRGQYQLQSVSFTLGDLFGLDESYKTVSTDASILVTPQLIDMEDIPFPSHSWQGDILVRRWIVEDPFVHAGVRQYSYGDPLQSINWNATARVGSLQVNKKDTTADPNLLVYVSFDLSDDLWIPITDDRLIEKGISYAATIAHYAISNGINTGFGCNSYLLEPGEKAEKVPSSIRIESGSGKGHFTYLLESMAKLKMVKSMSFNHFLKEDIDNKLTNSDIVILAAFVSDKTKEHIADLEKLGNTVTVVNLKDDDELKAGENHVG